jgi:hypothetical protein
MALNFSEKQLAELHEHRRTLLIRILKLQLNFQARTYKRERGKVYAFNGFTRRLGNIVRAIDRVFTILPPEREDIPEREELEDETIAIQAFVLNIVGCLDNLAWIRVCEKSLKAKNGAELSPKAVGLWKSHAEVRDSLSSEFREYLNSREPWFEAIKDFRDALSHRIPLYIPPYIVRKSNLDEFSRLDQEASEALRRGDHKEYDRLLDEQKKLGEFRPWMTHSLYEQSPTIKFHGQVLTDYVTIDELAWKMFEELER